MLENSRMTQTDQEIAGSARFFRSLLEIEWRISIWPCRSRCSSEHLFERSIDTSRIA